MTHEAMLTVQSDAMPDGSYGVSITVTDDRVFSLNRSQAVDYAVACYARATAAEHDGGVVRLLTTLGLDEPNALRMLTDDLHPERPPEHDATAPMAFTAALGRRRSQPDGYVALLTVSCDDTDLGAVSPTQLREHASAVLDTLAAADLDATLRRTLVSRIGIDDARARAVVGSLGDYMPADAS